MCRTSIESCRAVTSQRRVTTTHWSLDINRRVQPFEPGQYLSIAESKWLTITMRDGFATFDPPLRMLRLDDFGSFSTEFGLGVFALNLERLHRRRHVGPDPRQWRRSGIVYLSGDSFMEATLRARLPNRGRVSIPSRAYPTCASTSIWIRRVNRFVDAEVKFVPPQRQEGTAERH